MDYSVARRNMVDNQIRPNKVTSPDLLQTLLDVPRELFVPEAARGVAYVDDDVPLGAGRYLMEPMLFARMLQVAEIRKTDVVLDIGAVTGYGAAVLSKLAGTVVAIESDAALAHAASATLERLGIDNVAILQSDLKAGCPAQAPYDVIIFEGAVGEIPEAIAAQLAEGGRLVAVLDKGGAGEVVLAVRKGGIVSRRALFDAATPFLPGLAPVPNFVF